jgi:hypothetical protein
MQLSAMLKQQMTHQKPAFGFAAASAMETGHFSYFFRGCNAIF